MDKKEYYFSITIDGYTNNKEDIEILKSNLESEVWQEHVWISEPHFVEIINRKY